MSNCSKWLMLLLAAVLLLGMTACGQDGDDGMVTLWALTEVHYEVSGKDVLVHENRFDEQGRLTYVMDCRKTGLADPSLNTKATYTYNENGDCIRIDFDSAIYARFSEDARYNSWEYTYDYDESGNKTAKYMVQEDGLELQRTYEYENGILTKILMGTESYYAFDHNGNITQRVEYFPGVPDDEDFPACYDVWWYTYDQAGRLTLVERGEMETLSEKKDELLWQYEIRYDEKGNPTEGVYLNRENAEPLQYRTDGNGNIVGHVSENLVVTNVFTEIRVTREQARKLMEDNIQDFSDISNKLEDNAYFRSMLMPVMYRIEG